MAEEFSPFICLDSDVIIDALHGNSKRISEARGKGKFCTTTHNIFELFKGAFYRDSAKEFTELEQFLDQLPVILPSVPSSKQSAKLSADLKRSGLELSDGDVIIAAICLEYNCALLTNNKKHFSRIKGLKLI